jgi:hypothetical protein
LHGGAAHISQMSNRRLNISGSDFVQNAAAAGSGGALFLGTWSCRTDISDSSFVDNTAAMSGGAVRLLGIGRCAAFDRKLTCS